MPAYLRARKSAAPLKQAGPGRGAECAPNLRARKSAAPLKLFGMMFIGGWLVASPRSKERGSVEASRLLAYRISLRDLRARKSAAPLKRGDRCEVAQPPGDYLRARKSAAPLKRARRP